MLNLIKGSLQQELDSFFQVLEDSEIPLYQVTKAAFSKARKQLSGQAFVELNQNVLQVVYEQAELKRWKGFRVCAVDGSKCRLPDEAAVREHYGVHGNGTAGEACPMALVSGYYDVLNHLMVDARIAPIQVSERTLATCHLADSHPDDLIVYDRGYPAFWFLALHKRKQRHFCMRVKRTFCQEVETFIGSGATDQIVVLQPNKSARRRCREQGLSARPLRVRLIRVLLDSGEIEVLMTSLLDQTEYPASCFRELYHLRWNIEEGYKRLKSRLEVENFSGKSVLSIEQDFHAKILTQNLTVLTTRVADEPVERNTAHRQHAYQINMTQALSRMKNTVVLLLTRFDIRTLLEDILKVIINCVEPIRPDRKVQRQFRPSRRNRFNPCYKRAL